MAWAKTNQAMSNKEQLELNTNQMILLYANSLRFLKNFMYSKHPNTICWLLEIMYILSNKLKAEDVALNKKIKNEFADVFNILLTSCATIISDPTHLKYSPQYGIDRICFSPHVYEMLKRYEFNRLKNGQQLHFSR